MRAACKQYNLNSRS